MKRVYFSPAGKIHPSQHNIINYPPDGYKFFTKEGYLNKIAGNSFMFNKVRLQVLDRIMPLTYAYSLLDMVPKCDLVYSYNHIIQGAPYIVNVEWANVLAGRSPLWYKVMRREIGRKLNQPNCKKILTWTKLAQQSVINAYGKDLDSKCVVLPPAVPAKVPIKKEHKRFRILFVGTTHLENDFEEKGGRIVLKVFEELHKKHKDIELIMRCTPPLDINKNIKGVTWYTERLPWEKLEDLYYSSDVFFFPTHLYQNTILIEAMSYGLPIVTTTIGSSVNEYVVNGENGFVEDERINYFKNNILVQETTARHKFIKSLQADNPRLTANLANSISTLIENPGLRKAIREKNIYETTEGKFSIGERNKKLKEILDEACS